MNTWRAKIHPEIEFCNTSSFIGAPHNRSMLRLVLRRTKFYDLDVLRLISQPTQHGRATATQAHAAELWGLKR